MTTATTREANCNNYGSINIIHFEEEPKGWRTTNRRSIASTQRLTALLLGLAIGVFALFAVFSKDSFPSTPFYSAQLSAFGQNYRDHIGTDDDQLTDPPHFIQQKVDHFDDKSTATYYQRYYRYNKHFGGPGHPIFLVMGGEGPAIGLFYPFVNDHLAKRYKGYVVQPEHRFYGASIPFKVKHNRDFIGVLTPEQAIADALHLLSHTQKRLGCSTDRTSKNYCPVITVGGSYPGFLAAMLRIVHPNRVDMAYASSSPLPLYAQHVDPNAYFELITRSAERASAGCADAVRTTLKSIDEEILKGNHSIPHLAKQMNICKDFPKYIDSREMFAQELMMVVGAGFADFNMGNYPPTDQTELAQACHIFQDGRLTTYDKMDRFLQMVDESNDVIRRKCGFDFRTQIPDGPNGTVSSADWSGGGGGSVGRAWDFQTCTDLIVQTSFSENSMFPPREWTLDWLTQHCQSRFGLNPTPTRLVDMWHFDDLPNRSSHIIFTNGLNDGWSTCSIVDNLSPTIVAINYPNGAHHSDLSDAGPTDSDPNDIQQGFIQISDILGRWLSELKGETQGK